MQCQYCYNGQIIKGVELLSHTPQPTEAQILTAMNGHLCQCGTYPRLLAAIKRRSPSPIGLVYSGTYESPG
jgi:isoquinoline 1-oxidoreductase alpha subunit